MISALLSLQKPLIHLTLFSPTSTQRCGLVWVSHSSLVFWVQNKAKGAVEFRGLEKGEREEKWKYLVLIMESCSNRFVMAALLNFALNFYFLSHFSLNSLRL